MALAQAERAWHITNSRALTGAATNMATTVTPATEPAIEASVFWLRHKNEIFVAVAIVLFGLIAAGGYWFYNERRNASAAQMCAASKNAADYQNVIAQYPGTPATATAYVLLADRQRNEQKFADANATLQTFIAKFPKHELVSTAWMAIAANLESLGKKDEALTTYQRLTTSDPHSFNAPLAMLSQVRLLKEKGRTEEARRVCENVLTQYRDSFVAGEATRQLRSLKPPEPAVPAAGSQNAAPIQPAPAPAASPAGSLPKP